MSELEGRGATWTEERGTSDEGRRRLKGAPEASGELSTSDEGRRRLKGAPEASGELSTSDEGRRRSVGGLGRWVRLRRRPDARSLVRPAVIAVLLLFVLFALPQLLSLYYIGAMTQVAVYAIVALGLGVLVGRVGLVSLGQVAVLAIGAWVAARLLFATSLPYPVVLLGAGVITMVLGTLIGLPALRLRGLYLALITLMLAGGITVALAT